MNPREAFSITAPCAGLRVIADCERHEDEKEHYAERRRSVYRDIYNTIPESWRGSLLNEAIGELAHGDTLDDQIIEAYRNGDQAEAGRLLFLLLDKQRRVIAESETRDAMNE